MSKEDVGAILFLLCLFFCLFLYTLIEESLGFTYTDELFCLLMVSFWIVTNRFSMGKEFKRCILVFLFYLVVSFFRGINVVPAIVTDFVIQLKPFLIYYIVRDTKLQIGEKWMGKIKTISFILPLLLVPLGVFHFGEEDPEIPFFGHQSRYGSFMTIMGMVYLWSSQRSRRDILISILIVGLSVLSTRSKSYGFVASYVFLLISINYWGALKIMSIKAIGIILLFLSLVIYVGREKILFYFVEGSDSEYMMARPALYISAVDIFLEYPILGSGFGTFASNAAAKYYSPLYVEYGLDNIFGLDEEGDFLSDTFFPEMAQFGFLGLLLFGLFWKNRIVESKVLFKQNGLYIDYVLCLLIFIFVMIESFVDSTFTQNRGMVVMMFLGIIQNGRISSEDSPEYEESGDTTLCGCGEYKLLIK